MAILILRKNMFFVIIYYQIKAMICDLIFVFICDYFKTYRARMWKRTAQQDRPVRVCTQGYTLVLEESC